MERAEEQSHAVVDAAANSGGTQEVAVPDAGTLARCGYLLMASSVAASWAGLADRPAAAFSAYALLLLGFAFISLAVLAPAKPKTM